MTGRAVRRPELAGLAVATAQYAGRHRRLEVVAVVNALALAGMGAVVGGWFGWALGSAVLAPATVMLAMAMNAGRAEAANRALLEG